MRQYPLLHNGVEVGTVRVHREGMYCRIICSCTEDCSPDCSVVVVNGDESIDLGKCSRDTGGYVLRRFVPAKMLGHGELIFSISDAVSKTDVLALNPQEAFPAIALLPHGRFIAEPLCHGIAIEVKHDV